MYLGIDIGTSELKALIINTHGEIVAAQHATLSVQRPHPHWAEQDPECWWQACSEVLAGLRHQFPLAWAAIRAIGLSGQMHGAVLLDAGGRCCVRVSSGTTRAVHRSVKGYGRAIPG